MRQVAKRFIFLLVVMFGCFALPGSARAVDTMTLASGASVVIPDSWVNLVPPMACVPTGADLTYVYAFNPCTWTRLNLILLFALEYKGGVQVVNYLQSWGPKLQAALKNMTAQLHASFIDQTRQIGSMMDAESITKAARVLQTKEVEAKKRYTPSELACTSGSYGGAMSRSLRTATSLTQGFKFDMAARSGGAAGQASASGPLADMSKNWQEYCKEFHDPASNAGISACPSPTTPGTLVNGDIDIEGFLLKDTIDMAQPSQYKASLAMMRNLVEPRVIPTIDKRLIDSPAGREWVLKREHLESARNIAVDVVASIISRRAAIPGTGVGMTIKEIRVNAGIPSAKIATNPSYNEIMLAMTKERFFDPEYYVRMNGNNSAIKQEQAALEAYATVQLQDIYKLQEQINALLAARASLRFSADPLPEYHERDPL